MINIAKTWLNRFKPDNAETKDKNPQFHKIVGATSFTNCINLTDKENIVIRYPLFFYNRPATFQNLLSSSSFEEISTPGQIQTGLGPRVYPFTTPDCCTA